MAIDVMNIAKSYLTDAVISRVSNSLGESPEGVQKALTGALPVVLGSLISRTGTPDGPHFLSSLLRPFVVSSTASVTDADDPDTLMERGRNVVSSLFGPGGQLVAGALSQYAGVKTASAAGLLGLAGGIVAGELSRQALDHAGQLDVNNLTGLLTNQRENVRAAMPAPLAGLLNNIPGLDALNNLTGKLGSSLSGLKGAVTGAGNQVRPAPDSSANVPPTHTPAYSNTGSSTKVWPWLVALGVIALGVFTLRGCGDTKPDSAATMMSTTDDTTAAPDATLTADTVAASTQAMTDTLSSATATTNNTLTALGDFGGRKLPGGVELTIPAKGIENKLIDFIEDPAKPVDETTWFNFDRLLYETASAKLRPESREQLQNIAAILKAYPAVALKIGGYTDNRGKAAANKKLSQERAESAVNELVSMGVAPARLEAEGYGSEHPVASNAMEAGRAQNRRTACRVTKK